MNVMSYFTETITELVTQRTQTLVNNKIGKFRLSKSRKLSLLKITGPLQNNVKPTVKENYYSNREEFLLKTTPYIMMETKLFYNTKTNMYSTQGIDVCNRYTKTKLSFQKD